MTHHTPQGLPPYIYGWEAGPNEKVWNEAAVREALRAQAASVPVDPGHLSDLRYVLNVLKKVGAQDEVDHGDVLAAIVGMNYVIARTETAPKPQAVAAPKPAQAVDAMRRHVEDFAIKTGWDRKSGEGAFEFVQRASYSQGWKDHKAEAINPHRDEPKDPTQAVDAEDELREALRMGVECLRNWKILHPEDFDDLDERAVALLKAALATKETK